MKNILRQLMMRLGRQSDVSGSLAAIQQALGRIESRQLANVEPGDLQTAEFKVFSQWGEDGILEHLVRHLDPAETTFVEFGVQDYRESNTRFLLTNRNWKGLVIDGSVENIQFIRRDDIYWKHTLQAVAAFVTRENINDIISSAGIAGEIGLLSVDIDGNDYWVWEAIDCISPRIVVAEYNGLFGKSAAVSVPYHPEFQRTRAHSSNLYWGCSLPALEHLGRRKGYILVGCNSAGNNAFFVRKDACGPFKEVAAVKAFREPRFREARNSEGKLVFPKLRDAVALVAEMPLHDVVRDVRTTVGAAIQAPGL